MSMDIITIPGRPFRASYGEPLTPCKLTVSGPDLKYSKPYMVSTWTWNKKGQHIDVKNADFATEREALDYAYAHSLAEGER